MHLYSLLRFSQPTGLLSLHGGISLQTCNDYLVHVLLVGRRRGGGNRRMARQVLPLASWLSLQVLSALWLVFLWVMGIVVKVSPSHMENFECVSFLQY